MKEAIEKVKLWQVATGNPVAAQIGIPPYDRVRLRAKLLMEETMETVGALIGIPKNHTKAFVHANNLAIENELDPKTDLVEVADGLADMLFVLIGTALEIGIPLEPVFDEVCRSNMSKIGAAKREDGKTGKGDNYSPPEIGRILAENGWAN